MRALVQRVREAAVQIGGEEYSRIGKGLLVFIGIEHSDTEQDAGWLARKLPQLRIFSDDEGLMNKSVIDIRGELLVVSQFTLHARTKKGNRPSFTEAARPEQAIPLYNFFIEQLREAAQLPVSTGVFGADMQVILQNDGPVTLWLDTRQSE